MVLHTHFTVQRVLSISYMKQFEHNFLGIIFAHAVFALGGEEINYTDACAKRVAVDIAGIYVE